MAQERVLDVSMLEPPEPLERALDAVETLRAGEYLRMIFPREPHPLFTLLEQYGVEFLSDPTPDMRWEVRAWLQGDTEAARAAHASVPGSVGPAAH